MEGINFLIDSEGKRTAVVIDLKKHGAVWEDFYDHIQIENSRSEPKKSLQEIRAELKAEGRV